jgi:hypothetical protein
MSEPVRAGAERRVIWHWISRADDGEQRGWYFTEEEWRAWGRNPDELTVKDWGSREIFVPEDRQKTRPFRLQLVERWDPDRTWQILFKRQTV